MPSGEGREEGGSHRLTGKAALVTGGSGGLGLAIAEAYLREGARVVLTGRDRRAGRAAQTRLGSLGTARFIAADVMDPRSVERSVELALGFLGGLDVLVNNAGVAVMASVIDTPVEAFDYVMGTNVRGYFLYAKACFPHLVERSGCMIHIASDAGIRGEQPLAVYSVSKTAVIMLSKMLALDGGPVGVRSNCICPTSLLPGMRHMGPPGDPMHGDDPEGWIVPSLGRVGRVEDVTGAAVFFASADADFCTGSLLLVDGGGLAGVSMATSSTPGT
jgi:NAD(P)-dependent dehydrogenase (short-subunit alcohol dehydrogenase family)